MRHAELDEVAKKGCCKFPGTNAAAACRDQEMIKAGAATCKLRLQHGAPAYIGTPWSSTWFHTHQKGTALSLENPNTILHNNEFLKMYGGF